MAGNKVVYKFSRFETCTRVITLAVYSIVQYRTEYCALYSNEASVVASWRCGADAQWTDEARVVCCSAYDD